MSKTLLISEKINNFYDQPSEDDRLKQGLGPLEFERNKVLIGRFLSESKNIIVDIGGGTGKYAEWLAKKGHQVSMIDPVQKHINLARKRSNKLNNKFKVIFGEARNLDIPDNYADMVIMHGPLYHLQKKEERQKAILEAKRITKKYGIILGFAINYTASTLVGLLQGSIHEKEIFEMCYAELRTGEHNAPESIPGILTEAYYHRPDELKSEFEQSELTLIEMFAVEGIIWLDKNYFSSRADKKKYNNLLDICKITEKDMNLMAFSPHMMIAVRK